VPMLSDFRIHQNLRQRFSGHLGPTTKFLTKMGHVDSHAPGKLLSFEDNRGSLRGGHRRRRT
jgi:hypothetical protein